jgi:hypothetical protein
MDHGFPLIRTCRYIQEGDFVSALAVIAARNFDRITGIADIDEVNALDHASFINIQTGYYASS